MENGKMKVLIQQGDKDDSTTVYKVERTTGKYSGFSIS